MVLLHVFFNYFYFIKSNKNGALRMCLFWCCVPSELSRRLLTIIKVFL